MLFNYFSFFFILFLLMTSRGSSDSKESACNAGDLGSIPGAGRSHGERHGNPLHTPLFLPGESHGQRVLKGYSP